MTDRLQLLKEKGYKLTKQRREILRALEEGTPLAAEDILAKINVKCRINLSTIYRNLNILLKNGLIRKISTLGQADCYELVDPDCRHSLACLGCGNTIGFSHCHFDQIVQELEEQTGYEIRGHALELFGRCPACRDGHSS
ncbi:MAG TPA: transcriptional repressor [Firmicutes bacterium]|jgi:Fe2+ or Zn2+ uptake regulation protein|nr:transcriptional repressor [Bacillota bacterium]HOQ23511.1 Fur family transcriptional regulator [Bacillota bacterium]HPT68007.1 Fur family transcriptional regulator [Bacillota bacterium]